MEEKRYGIVVGIDGSPLMPAVCDYSAWLAKKTGVAITLLHTINHHQEASMNASLSGSIGLGSQEELLKEITELEQQQSSLKKQHGKLLLKAAEERIRAAGVGEVSSIQMHGEFSETLTEIEDAVDFVVLGKRGQAHADETDKIGGKLEVVLRSLHKPTLIVPGDFEEPSNFMIACDGSPTAEKAINVLTKSKISTGTKCHVVCVNKDNSTVEQAAAMLSNSDFEQVFTTRLTGDVSEQLETYQSQHSVDVTVMGAYSHNKIVGMLLGSFTKKMLLKSEKPLLLVR